MSLAKKIKSNLDLRMFRDLQLLDQMISWYFLVKIMMLVTISTLCNEQSAGSKVGAGVPAWPVPDK